MSHEKRQWTRLGWAKRIILTAATTLLMLIAWDALPAQDEIPGRPVRIPGLRAAAEIIRDTNGIAHIRARSDHDLFFLQGYIHARDRLFQMDFFRHLASGTLAELVGTTALPQDVQLRTLGLRRAGERSWAVCSERGRRILQAYADGVNACLASVQQLPPEYGALGVTQVDPWVPVDTLTSAKLLMYQQIFTDFDVPYTVALKTYQVAGAQMGFDGTKLFYEDLDRAEPFFPTTTIPQASASTFASPAGRRYQPYSIDEGSYRLLKQYLKETDKLEFFRAKREDRGGGSSNQWVVSGRLTASGMPLQANDPHVTLLCPATWYPIHLTAGQIDVTGQSFPGTPTVIIGHNSWIAWGTTATAIDTLDYYSEQVAPDTNSPSGLSTVYRGTLEPVIPIPETYRARVGGQLQTIPPGGGIPAATLIVPRRNNGPVIQLNAATGAAVSMQWAEFSGSHELEATLLWAEARTVEDFERGVRLFTFPQNFTFVDRAGNIGYYTSGEIPIREDLQAGTVYGSPPWMLRDGRGGNEWLAVTRPQPGQALPFEILPFEEMPQVLNPPEGYIVNANNDPVGVTVGNDPLGTLRPGGGIYYLGYQFNPGQRTARITELLEEKTKNGRVGLEDMQKIQADTVLMDARFFVPFITQAFQNAMRAGAPDPLIALALDPSVAEAVGRLNAWDFTTPTGLPQGYDAGDTFGQPNERSAAKIAKSVATTIFALWRSQFVAGVIDAKLLPYGLPVPADGRALVAAHHLLEAFPTNQGIGASGINFFAFPGVVSAADRRDIYILKAVKDGLALLAGDGFKNAFGKSTNQNDYRWGKLNRIVLTHPLGSIFSIPPAGGTFPSPLANLAGIPVDGGNQTVDPTNAVVRGANENAFMGNVLPVTRSVAEALPSGVRGLSSLAGGINGVVGSPLYWNLLPGWLTNSYYEQYFGPEEVEGHIASVTRLVPVGVGLQRRIRPELSKR